MAQIQFNQLLKIKNDGLVFYGLSDKLEDFKIIINNEINKEQAGTGKFEDKFKDAYEIYTQNGRRDIVLEFAEKPNITMGRLAIWRFKLNGLASWVSDYVVNNRDDFELDLIVSEWYEMHTPTSLSGKLEH